MANAVYPLYKGFLLTAAANVSLDQNTATDGPFCRLVDTGVYTYSSAHDFADDITGAVGTDQRITSPTTANGTFDGNDITYTAVTGATVEALVIYRKNSGANTTWKVVLYLDTSVTGLPVTPNGGDITVAWHASGIFTLSDRRLKENLREVGDLRGVLPVYEYNYIGQDQKRVGVMAQDAEKVVPDAVVQFRRFKAVNYDRVIERLAA